MDTENVKKPQTAFFLWLNANREKIAAAAGSNKIGDVGRKASEMWGKVSSAEKAPFEEQHRKHKERYEAYRKSPEGAAALKSLKDDRRDARTLKDERRSLKAVRSAGPVDENLKRPVTAYWLWLGANRESIANAIGTSKGSDVSKKGGEMWSQLSAKEKEPFEKESKAQKDKYQAYVKSAEGAAALKCLKDEKRDAKAAMRDAKAVKRAARSVEKDTKLKRPVTAYWLWLGANRESIAKAIGTSKASDVSKKGGEMWSKLSAKEKEQFEKESKAQREEYQAYVKSAEGEAALRAFKDARAAAKADVIAAKHDEPIAKRSKVLELDS